jgi:hypothetical protein
MVLAESAALPDAISRPPLYSVLQIPATSVSRNVFRYEIWLASAAGPVMPDITEAKPVVVPKPSTDQDILQMPSRQRQASELEQASILIRTESSQTPSASSPDSTEEN